jgi:transcriptional regulator of acetoin/glycerol metabolism
VRVIPSNVSDKIDAQGKAQKAAVAALQSLLEQCNGNQAEAARRSGCNRVTIARRVERLGLAEWGRERFPLSARQPKKKTPAPPK